MTPSADTDRLVRGWLRQGPDRLPDHVLSDVLGQLPAHHQRQRNVFRWLPLGRNVLGVAAAAAAAIVLLAVLVLSNSNLPSVGPETSPSPSATSSGSPWPAESSTPAATAFADASLSPKPLPSLGPGPTVLFEATGVGYPESLVVGDALVVTVDIRNRGDAPTEPVALRFGGLSDNAKLVDCHPACATTVLYGEIRVVYNLGVAGGETTTFMVEFLTTKPGDLQWTMTAGEGDRQPFLANGHTYISPARTLTPTIAAPPVNDAPPGPMITSLPYTDTTNVTLAQIHAMEGSTPCGSGGKSVWYSYTAQQATTVAADTFGSDYDTILDIWRGSLTTDYLNPGFETLQLLVCNDDADGPQSAVVFAAEAGQGYVIRVSAKESIGGTLTFHLLPG